MVFKPQRFHEEGPEVGREFPVDATLETAVADALASSEGVDASALRVIARRGEILLLGKFDSQDELDRAIEISMAIAGVSRVRVTASESDLT
ncbi:BON domain-containing protein [Peteryoungia desertarenae]|uniref:BON domain-containing protein n=1 Tax=Peteryoungia desertarenae TaxID=1813451 RepID=A0ABX6QLH7_9HYPH|nr:BON domain-containing protein [Peteryoungia desertarenae]QLF69327.1 BON domain-containing protein [Peteryoungia desertarenae]